MLRKYLLLQVDERVVEALLEVHVVNAADQIDFGCSRSQLRNCFLRAQPNA
jgi:hypothetical protein